ncbi:acyltransferase [Butyrivibrio sp. JL13D10]|uniref:acyltransferase n=1 Tax=Butyrivibrio sp. JL13D10 TaxID=3236815 RepID=UPI0038B68989
MKEKVTRQSNIELLRIIATCMVIVLHYNSTKNGGFSTVTDGSISQFILVTLESVSISAVNIFVIITGYFLCKTNVRDFLKPFGLVAQVLFFAAITFLIQVFLAPDNANIDTLIEYVFSSNWYVYVFFALYLISPFVNVMWNRLNDSGRRILITFMVLLFSIYPTIIDIIGYWSGRQLNGSSTIGLEGSQAGYTIVNFIVLYLIGAYIRDTKNTTKTGKIISTYFICLCLNMAWSYADGMRSGKNIYDTVSWNYSNPLVIAEAALLFMLFKEITIKNNKYINILAKASFTVYILHLRFIGLLGISEFVSKGTGFMFLHLIACIIILYLVCTTCYFVFSAISKPISKFMSRKLGALRMFSI